MPARETVIQGLVDRALDMLQADPNATPSEILSAEVTILSLTIDSILKQTPRGDLEFNKNVVRSGLMQLLMKLDTPSQWMN